MSSLLRSGVVLHNRYRVEQLIGQGGMGAVYEATDMTFGSTVALKQRIMGDTSNQQQAAILQGAFEREASILHHLRHPALPRVTDFFSDSNGQFLVMDFVPGEDLAHLLERRLQQHRQPFAFDDVLDWADQVLDVLDYLHTRATPVIHRDIKPHNLKLTPRGDIILLDLGLAKVSTGQPSLVPGSRSIFAYTLAFAPLEQIQGTGTETRSDLYSLAMTMYTLLTGMAPTDMDPPCDAMSRATATLFNQPDPLRPLAGLPEQISTVLMQALALRPDDRPANAAAMRAALRAARQKPAPRPAPPRPQPDPPAPPRPQPDPPAPPRPQPDPPAPPRPQPDPPAPPRPQPDTYIGVKGVLKGYQGAAVMSIAVSPDSQLLAAGSSDQSIYLLNLMNGMVLRVLQGHSGGVRSVAFAPDGQKLVSGADDGTVRIWRVGDGKMLHTLTSHTDSVRSVAFAPDGQTFATGSWDKTVRLWRTADGALQNTLQSTAGDVFSIAFAPDGQTLAVGCSDSTVQLWRVSNAMQLFSLQGHSNWVWSIAFAPDGQTLATGSVDRTVRLWRVYNGSLLHVLQEHTRQVWSVAFSPNGKMLASGSGDKTVRLWRVSDGSPLRVLAEHQSTVTSVAFAAEGKALISGSEDSTLRVWSLGVK